MRGTTVCARSHSIRNHLQGKKKTPITWCAQACQDPHLPGHIYGYADASFADVKPEKTLSMGYVFLINNAAVSWRATHSPTGVLNACEAEVVSLSSACQEVVYLRKLCNELGFIQTSPLQYIKIVKALSPFEGKSILKSIQTHLTTLIICH